AELMGARMREAVRDFTLSPKAPEDSNALREKGRSIEEAYQERLAEFLTAGQMKRLREIGFQKRGGFAFTTPQLQEPLKLTAEQRAKFAELAQKRAARDAEDARTGAEKARKERQQEAESIRAVLTPEQRKLWAGLVGEPFDDE